MIESGFDGLSVHVHGRNGCQHSAWFLPEECFPSDGTWQQVGTWASLNSNDNILTVGFETRTCFRVCQIDSALQTLKNLTVVAHGTSWWVIKTPPRHCDITYLSSFFYPTTLPACQEPPSTTTNTTLPTCQEPPSTTTNTVALIVGIVVVGIVVVGIVMVGIVVVVVSIVGVGIEVVGRKPARIARQSPPPPQHTQDPCDADPAVPLSTQYPTLKPRQSPPPPPPEHTQDPCDADPAVPLSTRYPALKRLLWLKARRQSPPQHPQDPCDADAAVPLSTQYPALKPLLWLKARRQSPPPPPPPQHTQDPCDADAAIPLSTLSTQP